MDSGTAEARRIALDSLVVNVKTQGYVPDGAVQLPAYVPYVGASYFSVRPRVLCYAFNQNLSQHARWAPEWLARWKSDTKMAIDRLNYAAAVSQVIPIKPYAEGFIPLLAAIALTSIPCPSRRSADGVLDEHIAVSNFVKFSTVNDAMSSSIPCKWWKECGERYVQYELEVLTPDIIIAVGTQTTTEVKRVLAAMSLAGGCPLVLHARFPSRIPSLPRYQLTKAEKLIWLQAIVPLANRLRQPPEGAFCKWRMMKFPRYFIETARTWGVKAIDGE